MIQEQPTHALLSLLVGLCEGQKSRLKSLGRGATIVAIVEEFERRLDDGTIPTDEATAEETRDLGEASP